ncbi:glycoside hydrolase family 79 protein [Multifurca ochricompacta]|uniref:Glycoside hydrolase family 79 protein n=1 Tax=Multifurca ochricompacta TaxID=376703 RepID=A0AAD4M012_9AGAM|nr:glycoside hydrolase family 79 protein [Multifurca ochricompacta]
MHFLSVLSLLTSNVWLVSAQVTIYQPNNQVIFGGSSSATKTRTNIAAAATYTGAAAYDPTILQPPPPPNPPIPTNQSIQLYSGGMNGLSKSQVGAFFGFSIEMSVATHVLGKNSSLVQVPFLNLMANIKERAGWVQVRVGGNTQESAELVQSLPNGTILAKDTSNAFNPTGTPPLAYTSDLLYLMNNISAFTNTRWFLGLPFFNTTPFAVGILEQGQAILGNNLIALQAGNEPDLYAQPPRTHRPTGYSPFDYMGDIGSLINQVSSNSLVPNKNNLFIIPSISATVWTPEQVWDTGIVGTYTSSLYGLAVERYPANNCAAVYGTGKAINPQDVFPNYLTHNASTNLITGYLNSTQFAMTSVKPMLMFETNTASCSGFPGISDSFGAALWGLDWAFTMAYNNFSTALFHVGGQNAYYNPFTPPPTNQSSFHQWTIGPIYYSALVMAEALGPSNASQVLDITQNEFAPTYVIYENGTPTKLALFNFITDPSGANDWIATFSVGGGQTGQPGATPSSVKVKYLSAPSVSTKGNFTWAGQTFGNNFESDGRLQGNLDVQTVNCDTTAGTCQVKVPAPSFTLVFLTDTALSAVSPGATLTFPTSAVTRTANTVFIDPTMLSGSNGHYGMQDKEGATSSGSSSGALGLRQTFPGSFALVCAVIVMGTFAIWHP